MNKQELVAEVARETGLDRAFASMVVDTFLDKLSQTIASGQTVRLVGFGAFSLGSRKSSAGRDPRTGARINIPAVAQARFRAGSGLKKLINWVRRS